MEWSDKSCFLSCNRMDDHERRREAMKKKFQENLQLHEMTRAQNREALGNGGEIHEGGVNNGKNTSATQHFSCISLPCTAKAA